MGYRSACITGATGGIGAAFARALPSTTDLLLHGRNEETLDRLSADLAGQGRRVQKVVADLASDDGRQAVIAAAEAAEIDLLINNAGLGAFGPHLETPVDLEHETVEVNVVACVVLTRSLLPTMLSRAKADDRRCGLVFLSSTAAYAPLPWFATYAASKVFELHYAEALAGELEGEPVDVLAVCPGPVDTNFFSRSRGVAIGGLGMLSAESVARSALHALGRRNLITVGLRNKGYRALMELLPRAVQRPFVRAALRRTLARFRARG